METIFKIEVPKEVIGRLQTLSFDIQTRSEIITKLIEDHKNDVDASILSSPVFLEYSKQLSELKAEFEIAKIALEKDYVPEEIYGKVNYRWNLDFSSNELTVNIFTETQPDNIAEEATLEQI